MFRISDFVNRICLVIALFIFTFFFSGCARSIRYKTGDIATQIQIAKPMERLCAGERLTYKIEWMGLDVGIARLCIEDIRELNGRLVYYIVATAETTPIISKIYKVEDKVATYLDVEYFYPLRLDKKQREGSYRADGYIDFDHTQGKAFYFSRLNNEKKESQIPNATQDILSCMYYFRLQDVGVGKSIFANVHNDEKNYLLEARIHNKGVINIRGLGRWDAFLVEPLPWFQGKVKRKALADIWFSADEKRLPLLITTKGIPFVGTVTITLQKIEEGDVTH